MLRKLKNNDGIISKLWDECSETVRKICEIKLLSHHEAAKDVYSEVFIAFTEAYKSERGIDYPKAWIYKVTNNLISQKIKELNKEKVSVMKISEYEPYILSFEENFDDSMISDSDIEKVADTIMGELREEDRELLEYFHYRKMSMKEIALLTGRSEGAVKQRHYRLCKQIKKRVKEEIEKF